MCHWLWRQHLSAADLQVRGIQCGHVQKRSWQQRVGMFPTWRNTENSKSPGQALVTTPMFLFLTSCVCCLPPGWLATGTCRWWGNLTPLWWGVGLSSACDERVWDDSWSWAAAERWWSGRGPEEGLHLQEENRGAILKNKGAVQWYKPNFSDWVLPDSGTGCPPITGNGLEMGTSLSGWLWETLGAASRKTQIQFGFGNIQQLILWYWYVNEVLLKCTLGLPISVCLVIGGATVAGLKAGPKRCFHEQ